MNTGLRHVDFYCEVHYTSGLYAQIIVLKTDFIGDVDGFVPVDFCSICNFELKTAPAALCYCGKTFIFQSGTFVHSFHRGKLPHNLLLSWL